MIIIGELLNSKHKFQKLLSNNRQNLQLSEKDDIIKMSYNIPYYMVYVFNKNIKEEEYEWTSVIFYASNVGYNISFSNI